MSDNPTICIDVAGDVCLDLVGLPEPPTTAKNDTTNNWQLTGETRTYYLPGGAMLLAHWINQALGHPAARTMQPILPAGIELLNADGATLKRSGDRLTSDEFLQIAERLKRDEVVHSLLELNYFKAKPEDKKKEQIRVAQRLGFSGPKSGADPSMELSPPDDSSGPADLLVLDDTGNRFRRNDTQWPVVLHTDDGTPPLVVYKLHRPLPGTGQTAEREAEQTKLWHRVAQRCGQQRIVIMSVDDLRDLDAPISRGLSWERTALELVWQLLNVEHFHLLRDCPHLIVRLGLDGAVYWRHRKVQKTVNEVETEVDEYRAWLIYDPQGIEGTAVSSCEGEMVGYGSVFTAAVVQHLALAAAEQRAKLGAEFSTIDDCLSKGIKAGLAASRELLRHGFGKKGDNQPNDPTVEIFAKSDAAQEAFACQPIPIIPYAATADRGYWRLLDSIFANQTDLLHRAVALTATKAKPVDDDDKKADALLRQVPLAVYKGLRTYDRREIENYRALYALMSDYVQKVAPPRPLSIAVFGPPGAGKSFGVKQVAKALGEAGLERPIEALTFNLSQYQEPDQLADAFHLVRDVVLQGKIPLVFFDEFDTSLAGVQLGWLRYFLAPMQDAEFLDRGSPHPIGQAIFIFAGGTCSTYSEFAKPFLVLPEDHEERKKFKTAKGPDFLSRLRGTLDIPGLDLNPQFDPYGPVDAFPCEAAILLRRAGILAFQLNEKAPQLADAQGALQIGPSVLRVLLHMPQFEHGNRSYEALLDMSRLHGTDKLTPAVLPGEKLFSLHGNAVELVRLLGTEYPYPPHEREKIARSIHKSYQEQERAKSSSIDLTARPEMNDWDLLRPDLKTSNLRQADDIAVKLRRAGLWFRKRSGSIVSSESNPNLDALIEELAQAEHARWVAEKRSQGWIATPTRYDDKNNNLLLHDCLFPWDELDEPTKDKDREPIRKIPTHLAAAGYEIVRM